MSVLDKLLNAPRRIRRVLSALVRMPTNVSGTHAQLNELRKELNTLNVAQADLKSELRSELRALNADRAEMKSEFLTQLGFYFHDFGRQFSDSTFQSHLQELSRIQSETKNLVLHGNSSLQELAGVQSEIKNLALHGNSSLQELG